MNKRITFRHMEHSNHLENHAEQQLEKIMGLLSTEKTPILVDLILEAHKLRGHNKVDFHVKTPNVDFFVSDEAPDMEQLVSSVIDTMYHKLREEKKRRLKKRTE
ncbi:HPF/RaiA family ribosome-associated protein [Candidatus Babeliales bacterium]|nr:HPF/RaiA family ribosome-associated protein [Candidatus Babeliales bacterium]